MEWNGAVEAERAALVRIAALLHALADLCQCAAGRCALVRGFVLWLMRQAEPVARDFVCGDDDGALASFRAAPAGGSPTDALRMAAHLRALALCLDWQARLLAAPCDDRNGDRDAGFAAGRPGLPGRIALPALAAIVSALRPLAPDTS